jgi:hypothetical protein
MHGLLPAGDEMGLGKTVQGCALLACYEDEWPALVITPSSLRQQWADALRKVGRRCEWQGVSKDTTLLSEPARNCLCKSKPGIGLACRRCTQQQTCRK